MHSFFDTESMWTIFLRHHHKTIHTELHIHRSKSFAEHKKIKRSPKKRAKLEVREEEKCREKIEGIERKRESAMKWKQTGWWMIWHRIRRRHYNHCKQIISKVILLWRGKNILMHVCIRQRKPDEPNEIDWLNRVDHWRRSMELLRPISITIIDNLEMWYSAVREEHRLHYSQPNIH